MAGIAGLALLGAGAIYILLPPSPRAPPAWAEAADRDLAARFGGGAPDRAAYDSLFRYLVSGYVHYRTPDGAGALMPGAPSWNGAAADRLEAFARLAPLIAAWLAGGGAERIETWDGTPVALADLLLDGLKSGTAPSSPGYWGQIPDRNQRIVEAEDIARALWISRDVLWSRLSQAERSQIIAWLVQAARADTFGNNWMLMPLLTAEVIRSLQPDAAVPLPTADYLAFRRFLTPDGWFTDGVCGSKSDGCVDYYNAWGIYYDLFWLDRVDPALDRATISADLDRFAHQLVRFITPAGFPIMGRSVCYRMGVPAPILAASANAPGSINPALARRALDAIWSYFITRGALQGGLITQGYFGADLRLLDGYSGPASCLWATRSLVIAFMEPRGAALWRDRPEARLPVEQGDFVLDLPHVGWRVQGVKATGEVRIIQTSPPPGPPPRLRGLSLRGRILQLFGQSWRPANRPAKYNRPVYSSIITGTPFTD